jgi:chromosome segregation ATPase
MSKKSELTTQIESGINQMLDSSKEHILSLTVGTEEELFEQLESYKSLSIDGINNVQAYKQAAEGAKTLRKWRTSIEAARKEITAPIDKFKTDLIEYERKLTAPIMEVENHLKADISRIDNEREEQRRAIILKRSTLLLELDYNQIESTLVLNGIIKVTHDQLAEMPDEEFQYYIEQGQAEKARKEAEAKRMEEERAEIELQRQQLQRELEEVRQLKAELLAQTRTLNQTYEEIEQPKPEQAQTEFPTVEDAFGESMAAPEPEPEPETKQEQVAATETGSDPLSASDTNEYQNGFLACRDRVLEYVTNPEIQLTRKTLAEFVRNLEI